MRNLLCFLFLGAPISVGAGESASIAVDGAFFAKRLKTTVVSKKNSEQVPFRDVGQVVAIKNPDWTEASGIEWSELDQDDKFAHAVTLRNSTYQVIGRTSLPSSVANQLSPGSMMRIARYYSQKPGPTVVILESDRRSRGSSIVQVYFGVRDNEGWLPGNICRVTFPEIKAHTYSIPKKSLVNVHGENYVVVQKKGDFSVQVRNITVLDETLESVLIMGDLAEGELVVSEGAILLKPLIKDYLKGNHLK